VATGGRQTHGGGAVTGRRVKGTPRVHPRDAERPRSRTGSVSSARSRLFVHSSLIWFDALPCPLAAPVVERGGVTRGNLRRTHRCGRGLRQRTPVHTSESPASMDRARALPLRATNNEGGLPDVRCHRPRPKQKKIVGRGDMLASRRPSIRLCPLSHHVMHGRPQSAGRDRPAARRSLVDKRGAHVRPCRRRPGDDGP
jgi:hypothetical protein